MKPDLEKWLRSGQRGWLRGDLGYCVLPSDKVSGLSRVGGRQKPAVTTWEAVTGRLGVQSHPPLQSEFKVNLNYRRSCLKTKTQESKRNTLKSSVMTKKQTQRSRETVISDISSWNRNRLKKNSKRWSNSLTWAKDSAQMGFPLKGENLHWWAEIRECTYTQLIKELEQRHAWSPGTWEVCKQAIKLVLIINMTSLIIFNAKYFL